MIDTKPERADRHALIAQYVDELRGLMPEAAAGVVSTQDNAPVTDLLSQLVRPPIAIEKPKPTWPWSTMLVLTLVLALGEAAVLLLPPGEMMPAPPAEVVALESADACLQRQIEIMSAIQRYARDRGSLPERLAGLGPPYLLNPWIDPLSGQPYDYQTDGRSVSLTCPNPDLHSQDSGGPGTDLGANDVPAEGFK